MLAGLKKKSAAADLSANAWLMAQLAANRPVLYREAETWDAIHFMDAAGREINAIARDFTGLATLPNPFSEQWTSGNLAEGPEKSGLTILSKYLLQP